MGTRGITIFRESDSKPLAVLYRQFDSYLEGHGRDLWELLSTKRVVNGIKPGEETSIFNGPGDLAVQVISQIKAMRNIEDAGLFYLVNPNLLKSKHFCVSYIYDITIFESEIFMKVHKYDEMIFKGTISQFGDFLKSRDEYFRDISHEEEDYENPPIFIENDDVFLKMSKQDFSAITDLLQEQGYYSLAEKMGVVF